MRSMKRALMTGGLVTMLAQGACDHAKPTDIDRLEDKIAGLEAEVDALSGAALDDSYFPLTPGIWYYQEHEPLKGSDVPNLEWLWIIDKTSVCGEECSSIMVSDNILGRDFRYGFPLVGKEGDELYIDLWGTEVGRTTLIKAPVEAGATWDAYDIWKEEVCSDCMTILSTSASVTTPAGEFEDVLHVRYFDSAEEEYHYYYARGVGLVLMISMAHQNDTPQEDPSRVPPEGVHGLFVWELVEYPRS